MVPLDKLSLYLADDHPVFRAGLREVISSDSRFSIIGEGGNGIEVLADVRTLLPRVLILDIEMPGMDGIEIAEALQREQLPVAVLMLTMFSEESLFNRAMSSGVTGYVLKDCAAADIVRAVSSVARGEYFVSPALARIRRRPGDSDGAEQVAALTNTERRVLDLIGESLSTRNIAERLFISPRTVEHHRSNICKKLNLSGSYALLRFCIARRGET